MEDHYVQVSHGDRSACFEEERNGMLSVCVSHYCDERESQEITLTREEVERLYELLKRTLGK